MLTVNCNCYHYYQKNSKAQGGACVRRRGRLCHGTMAQWRVQACNNTGKMLLKSWLQQTESIVNETRNVV